MSHYPTYPATGTTYPYAGYHPQTPGAYTHPQQSGAYPTTPYQPYGPATAVTGYGTTWPYAGYHHYYHQQQPQVSTPAGSVPKPVTATTTQPSTSSTTATTTTITTTATPTTSLAPRPSIPTLQFTSYNRDSALYGRSGRKGSSYRGLFTKELRNLMYGFGDDRNPASDTVNVMEEILVEFIADICSMAGGGKKTRLSIEDLRRVLSRPADAKKLARLEELLFMQEDIKRARKEFDEPDAHPAGSNS